MKANADKSPGANTRGPLQKAASSVSEAKDIEAARIGIQNDERRSDPRIELQAK